MPPLRPPVERLPRGFSLVELLVVIAVIALLIAVGSTSFSGGSGTRLTSAGVQCANLMESARDAAILRKNPVAVAIFPPGTDGRPFLSAFEFLPTRREWVRIWQWERLPRGIMIDPSFSPQTNSAIASNSPALTPSLPAAEHLGSTYLPGQADGYAYVVFLPSGALMQAHARPGMLRLIKGYSESGSVRRAGPVGQHVDLVVNPSTGRLKMVQPQ